MRTAISAAIFCLVANTAFAEPMVERLGEKLSHPWGMDFLDDAHVLVTERRGRMYRIALASGARQQITGLPKVYARGQGGLLDVLVHQPEEPADGSDPVIYYCYAKSTDYGAATAIDRAWLSGDELTDHRTIFVSNTGGKGGLHFGCRLAILDGHLYASLGDRGARENAQNPASHAGSTVRLSLDGAAPADNPDKPGWRAELFTKGHRSPQGLAINPATGNLWLVEHGPRGGDEVNLLEAGANYGWPRVSHGEEYRGGKIGVGSAAPGYVDPLWVWVPSIAPSGMAFYNGDMFPDLKGHLLVGSLKFNSLYLVELAKGRPVSETALLKNQIGRIRDVAVAGDGSILILTDEGNGGLYRMFQ